MGADGMFAAAAEAERKNLPFAIVTIIGADGVVPRKSGRMLVAEDGRLCSTIGGHLVEDAAAAAACQAIREGRSRRISVDTGKGSMELMIDVVNPVKRAYVIGYGYVGKALAAMLHSVGYELHVFDIKPFCCDSAAEARIGGSWQEILSGLVLDRWSAFIVTVHSSEDILSYIDYSQAFYIAAMGSRSQIVPDRRIHAPAGLDIGSETPEETAVSITAEVMRAYSRASGMPMNEKRWRLVCLLGDDEAAVCSARRLSGAGYDVLVLAPKPVDDSRFALISKAGDCFRMFDEGLVPVFCGNVAEAMEKLRPSVVIDMGGHAVIPSGPFAIRVGEGLEAPRDADAVIGIAEGMDLGVAVRNGSTASSGGRRLSGNAAIAVAGALLEAADRFFHENGWYR